MDGLGAPQLMQGLRLLTSNQSEVKNGFAERQDNGRIEIGGVQPYLDRGCTRQLAELMRPTETDDIREANKSVKLKISSSDANYS